MSLNQSRRAAGKIVLLLMISCAACTNPTALSKPLLADLVRPAVKVDNEQWCLNPAKLRYANSNDPIAFPSPADDAPEPPPADQPMTSAPAVADGGTTDNGTATLQEDSAAAPAAPSPPLAPPKGFPLIFAEETDVKWNDQDAYVMELLIEDGYIAVHTGGYPQGSVDPGTPGGVYHPETKDQVDAVITAIRKKGAVVDLTAKGKAAGVWDTQAGFCATGHWAFNEIEGWTDPAADQNGTIVTHIKSNRAFLVTNLGQASSDLNPMGFQFINDQSFEAEKYNDGWKLMTNSAGG